MPEIIMEVVGGRARETSVVFLMSPVTIVRWVEMVEALMLCSERILVSLSALRTTVEC
jgi:hypothetical protein